MKNNNMLYRNAGLIRARTLGSCTYTSRTKGSAVQKEAKTPSRKGQMFVIAAILVVVAVISLKNLLGIYSTFEDKRFGEMFTLDKQARNMKNEFAYTAGIATMQGDANLSGIRFLYNLSNFTTKDGNAKALYAFVHANGTSQKFSVTIGNFLKDTINVTINATDSTPAAFSFFMNGSSNVTREFQADFNGQVNLTFAYTRHNENTTERFGILMSVQRYAGLFLDVKVESGDEFVRSKDYYNRTW